MHIKGSLDGSGLRFGIVTSRWNETITDALTDAALHALLGCGVAETDIITVEVPGAWEIPLLCQRLAEHHQLDGIIALGCVIKGETTHFEHVSNAAMVGIRAVSLEFRIPVTCGILTTYTYEDALARAGDDEENKGMEAALAAVETANAIRALRDEQAAL